MSTILLMIFPRATHPLTSLQSPSFTIELLTEYYHYYRIMEYVDERLPGAFSVAPPYQEQKT